MRWIHLKAQYSMSVEKYVEILAQLKPKFIHHPKSKQLIQGILQDFGCDLDKTYFDVPRLREFMARVRDLGLHERVFILVGVGPLRSAKTAEWMRTHVPGVAIPDEVVNRLKGAQKQQIEGKRLCIEIIQQVREIPGVSGVHVMAYRQEELVAEIIEEAGLLPRRWQQEVSSVSVPSVK